MRGAGREPPVDAHGNVQLSGSGALADLLKRRFMTELHQSAERALGRGIAIRIDSADVE